MQINDDAIVVTQPILDFIGWEVIEIFGIQKAGIRYPAKSKKPAMIINENILK